MASTERSSPQFPRLPPGRSARSPESTARHRRRRLLAAIVEAVGRQGYDKVTIGDLVALAGVSNRDFYELFASKEECFLAAFEEIIERASAEVAAAYRAGSGFRSRLLDALGAFTDLLVAEPALARFAIVDSLSLGGKAMPIREQVEAQFATLARQSFAAEPGRGEVSEIALRAMVGGARRVAYTSLRSGHPERFAEHGEELLDWALSYQRPGGAHVLEDSLFEGYRRTEVPRVGAKGKEIPSWAEPPSSELSRKTLTARERILRAAGRVVMGGGYASLSVPAISSVAGISNETFYREFANKEEAFLEAFDALAERALERALPAFKQAPTWPEAVGAALLEAFAFIARNPLFAQLTLELAGAGATGLDRGDEATQRFSVLFSAEALPDDIEPLPEIVVEAIIGGIWTVIRQEIARGRAESLPALAPELVDFALVPFLGAEEACAPENRGVR